MPQHALPVMMKFKVTVTVRLMTTVFLSSFNDTRNYATPVAIAVAVACSHLAVAVAVAGSGLRGLNITYRDCDRVAI